MHFHPFEGLHSPRQSVARSILHFQAVASMYAGVDSIKKPTLKQKFLKRLLGIPIQILNKQSKDLPDESNDNP